MAVKRWIVKDGDQEAQERLKRELNISSVLAKLLVNRGYSDIHAAREFLYPSLDYLSSPFALENMEQGVEEILGFVDRGEPIVVYGDYDVDGICASVILYQGLESLGAKVDYYIPDRMEEGYGINLGALESIHQQGTKLVVTVDCGISAAQEIATAKEWGLEVIVTDHHQLPEVIPQCLIINPVMEPERTAKWANLCGAGVALKLVHGLLKTRYPEKSDEELLHRYLDVAALATVADIVELKGDNRIIVKYGMEVISEGLRPGLKALCDVSGAKMGSLTTSNLGFGLAPRVNACGRIGDPKLGVRLMLTTDEQEAKDIAEILNHENTNRQSIENDIINEAIAMVEQAKPNREEGLILVGENWHPGVIGIVASRLVERYYTPTIVLTKQEDGTCKGSGRSIAGFHLQQALTECQDLLGAFGGHSQAAGLSLPMENLPEFRKRFAEIIDKHTEIESFTPILKVDEEVTLGELNFALLEEMLKMQPTGQGNPEPVLVCRGEKTDDTRLAGANGEHLRLKFRAPSGDIWGIGFKLSELEEVAREGSIDVAFNLQKNVWNGNTSLQMMIKDLKSFKVPDSCSFVDRLFYYGHDYLKDDDYKGIEDSQCFYTKVVGVSFDNRQSVIAQLRPGQELELVRESTNIYDPNAIAIYAGDIQLGYLKKELARNLAPNLDRGIPYIAQVSQVTGGEEQHQGVNIFVSRKDNNEEESLLARRELKSRLSKLEEQSLQQVIQEAIIGQYPYRAKQQEALEHLYKGENVLSILGTGRGKSAIFQSYAAYLALTQQKITVIVYPLRSLVNDQYQSLQKKLKPLGLTVQKGTGALEGSERVEFFHRLGQGEIDVILTTPEFLACHQQSFAQLKERLGLVVVDEAHHLASRRIGYKALPETIKGLTGAQVLAVTATADDQVGEHIREQLNIGAIVVDSHVRDNLQIVDRRNYKDKLSYLYNLAVSQEKTVVYVNSRKQAYKIAFDIRERLPKELKDTICYYHGGLASNDRLHVENLFRDGALKMIISTNAFGEGIDIPDIKHVVLYHLSFSKKEYNQLAGRAGRNNDTANIHLLYGKDDEELNQLLLDGSCPSREQLGKFYLLLKRLGANQSLIKLSNGQLAQLGVNEKIAGMSENSISHWLGIFEELGLLQREGHGPGRTITIQQRGKVNLEDSVRYAEGLAEREDYQAFQGIAFDYDHEYLLGLMNKPIFPSTWRLG